jgi:putative aldouronate transport system substrate-binding protein
VGTPLIAAAVIVATVVTGGGLALSGTASGGTKRITTVEYQFPYFAASLPGVQAVQTALNKHLAKSGLAVNLQPIPYAAYAQKMQLQFAAGSSCDLVFTAPWVNNYYQLVDNHSLLSLDKLLLGKGVGSPTYKTLSPASWDAAKVNGHIYAVINQQDFPKDWGILVRSDLATKLNMSSKTITSFSQLTPYLAEMKADGVEYPLISDNAILGEPWHDELVGFDPILTSTGAGEGYVDVKYNDYNATVFNPYGTSQFMTYAELARTWYDDGYYAVDPPSNADAVAGAVAGNYGVILPTTVYPGVQAAISQYGTTPGWTAIALGKNFLNTAGTTATLTGICASSKHPTADMELLNALNTDPVAFDLLAYGIAGKDYTVVNAKEKLISIPTTSPWNPGTAWMFGDTFHGLYTSPQTVGTNPQVAKINADAPKAVDLGFVPNLTSLTTQIAQVSSAADTCAPPIMKGLVDPTTAIPACLASMNAAGEQTILSTIQKQLTSFLKAQRAQKKKK